MDSERNIENSESVKAFNNELTSLYECKPPISKAKVIQITKSAMKAIKYYKHVVMSVEKFIQKCRPEFKLPGLYVIDSICRQSKHQYGEKDVYVPRFTKNLIGTFQSLFKCADDDRTRIVRVILLWQKNNVFPENDVRALLDLAAGLGIDVSEAVFERNGNRESVKHKARTPSPIDKPSPGSDDERFKPQFSNVKSATTDFASSMSNAQQQQQRVEPERKLTAKLLADYDYSDEESGGEERSDGVRVAPTTSKNDLSENLAAAAHNLLKNPEFLQQIHQMQQSMKAPGGQLMHGSSILDRFHHPPPPAIFNVQQPPPILPTSMASQISGHGFPQSTITPPPQPPFVRGYENQSSNYPPPAEPVPREMASTSSEPFAYERAPHWPANPAAERLLDRDGRRRESDSRRRSRSRSTERKRRSTRSRSRSRSGSRGARRRRSRSAERRNREQERERRKLGLPPMKPRHISICSRTLWIGQLRTSHPEDVKEVLKDYGEPITIDIFPSRGCAYAIMPDRKSAFKVLDRLGDSLKIQGRQAKMAWAPGKGVKEYKDGWIVEHGVTYLPWDCLPSDLTALLDGGSLDVESLPDELKGSYNENGRVNNMASVIPTIQHNFAIAPPQFAGFPGIAPGVFDARLLSAAFSAPPPMLPMSIPIPNSTMVNTIRIGPLGGVPHPMPVTPSTITTINPLSLGSAFQPTTSAGDRGSSSASGQSLMSPILPFGQPTGLPNYARPVSFGRAGFAPNLNRGDDGNFGGQPHQQFRGRGRGQRGDFGRGRGFRGGGGPRPNWNQQQQQQPRFEAAGRNARSRWDTEGDERRGGSNNGQQSRVHRSRWNREEETFPNSGTDVADLGAPPGAAIQASTTIPVLSSLNRHHDIIDSNEPPPPGE